jgi:hypothetical protein
MVVDFRDVCHHLLLRQTEKIFKLPESIGSEDCGKVGDMTLTLHNMSDADQRSVSHSVNYGRK